MNHNLIGNNDNYPEIHICQDHNPFFHNQILQLSRVWLDFLQGIIHHLLILDPIVLLDIVFISI